MNTSTHSKSQKTNVSTDNLTNNFNFISTCKAVLDSKAPANISHYCTQYSVDIRQATAGGAPAAVRPQQPDATSNDLQSFELSVQSSNLIKTYNRYRKLCF